MIRARYAVASIAVIMIAALAIVAVPYYNAYELRPTPVVQASNPAFNPQPNDSNAFPPPPQSRNVTVLGVIKASQMAPACSLSNPPCAISPSSIFYVVVNGRNYRLIFANNVVIPASLSGTNVVITGAYVTPSTFNAGNWTPSISFYGDIYVYKVTFFASLPS